MESSTAPTLGKQRYGFVVDQLTELATRVDICEGENKRLKNTIKGFTRRDSNISIGPVCTQCHESYMLRSRGMLRCPQCASSQSL